MSKQTNKHSLSNSKSKLKRKSSKEKNKETYVPVPTFTYRCLRESKRHGICFSLSMTIRRLYLFFSWQPKNSFMGHDRKIPSSFITIIIGGDINYCYKRTGSFLMAQLQVKKKWCYVTSIRKVW